MDNLTILKSALKLYSNKKIQELIYESSKNKEVALKYTYGFGKRPMIFQYPSDIIQQSKKSGLSIHISEETWKNPLELNDDDFNADESRIGWDLILDIDGINFEVSHIASKIIVEFLLSKGIKKETISIKFSGNKGFHIAIPFEVMPDVVPFDGEKKSLRKLFPDGPKIVSLYISYRTKDFLRKKLMERYSIQELLDQSDSSFDEITMKDDNRGVILDPYQIVEIDTILISKRHLFRAPYSIHEKSNLVSTPINIEDLNDFNRDDYTVDYVLDNLDYFESVDFLNRDVKKDKNIIKMVRTAFDFYFTTSKLKKIEKEKFKSNFKSRKNKTFENIEIGKEAFEKTAPNCIKSILNGIQDGRKRAVFILTRYLQMLGWSYEEIEEFIYDWNKNNPESLKENYIASQMNYLENNFSKEIMPPNCEKREYYQDLKVCDPDGLCKNIKNPVNYAFIKAKKVSRINKMKEKSKKDNSKDKSDKSKDNSDDSDSSKNSDGKKETDSKDD